MDLVIGILCDVGWWCRFLMPWRVFETINAVVGSVTLAILWVNDMALRYVRIVEWERLELAR